MEAQGWYLDPYGIHGDRWFSAGQPTDLVRDDHVVSHDAPPDGEVPTPLVRAQESPPDSSDAKRADDAEKDPAYDAKAAFIAALDRGLAQGGIN